MNCKRPAAVLMTILALCLTCLSFELTGCAVAGRQQNDEHIFVGDAPENGVAQIATDSKVAVITKDQQGKTHYEKRSLGQFVVMPVSEYRKLRDEHNAAAAKVKAADPAKAPEILEPPSK